MTKELAVTEDLAKFMTFQSEIIPQTHRFEIYHGTEIGKRQADRCWPAVFV